jgi:exopolyphosphatase/guanosine-5'-triphosphate,3'-diphosphate pyrophosphatase
VDESGVLAPDRIEGSLAALARFGAEMDQQGVQRRAAIATSASRDAANREEFFDLARSALGVMPRLISGEEEARLAFSGATRELDLPGPVVVSDIGGGSTELVTAEGGSSYEIGSVRLTERAVPTRPAPPREMAAARALAGEMFAGVKLAPAATIGVAGTWTSLAAIALGLTAYDRERVHRSALARSDLVSLIEALAPMTVEQTAAIPSLDPKRAPVILGGALVAEAVMDALKIDEVIISEHDTLDGVAIRLLALP